MGVSGFVDDTHATFAEFFADLEVRDLMTCHVDHLIYQAGSRGRANEWLRPFT